MHPILAIVGRPNVGKSRLFNRLVGARRAIVADVPGVTRDRHYAPGDWRGREFIAVDTGGLELDPAADLERRVTDQSRLAIEEADVIICLFDGRAGPTNAEREIVAALRKVSTPVLYTVNKIDAASTEGEVHAFSELGVDPLFAISAEHGRGVDDLLDAVIEHFPPPVEAAAVPADETTIAVVGRPNVGKSTLINRLAGEERVVAHEVAGTTRDAIDVEIAFDGADYRFIDTAGMRRRVRVAEQMERFTALHSLRTIDRAEIVLQLLDGAEGLTKQDLHLTSFILEEGKGLVLLVNKWDRLQEEAPWEEYERRLRRGLGEMHDLPILPISGLTGYNCLQIFARVRALQDALSRRLSTATLNRVLERALEEHHLPVSRGRPVKIAYATQVETRPPTFLLFANEPKAVPDSYRRYLAKRFQEALGVSGLPVRLVCKRK